MGFAKVYSAQTALLKAHNVTIEVDLSRGLYAFAIVGLPDKAVEESRDRVSAAIKNSGFTSPKSKNHKVVISLAPADLKKEGPVFDVGIALAYLLAADEVRFNPEGKLFLGELSLDGDVRPVRGALPLAREAKRRGFIEVYVPEENAEEAALVEDIAVYGVRSLKELLDHLDTKRNAGKRIGLPPREKTEIIYEEPEGMIDMGDIRGQETAKRGLLIAAAGGHNIALFGPPGTGKTLLARAFSSVLPPLVFEDILEVTGIHSTAGVLHQSLITAPPFRTPHHTSSYTAMVGGGAIPRPGEVTLAHRGVLFLDEFPEFDRRVIESLREPLEEQAITIARARGSARFPAHFTLVAALNPCPCGNFESRKRCVCTPLALERYRKKISGPIIDRIDMWIEVGNLSPEKLAEQRGTSESKRLRKEVLGARARQRERFSEAGVSFSINRDIGVQDIDRFIPLPQNIRTLLNDAAQKLDLSPRAYHRVMKLARTIADLDQSKRVKESHLLEALQYRPKTALF